MSTVIRKSETSFSLTEKRRDLVHAVSWTVRSSAWSPPTDMYETDEAYILRVELAGMRASDFEITFEDGYLQISGTRPDVPERRAYQQMEIRFGRFSTTVGLPGPVDVDASRAEYDDGFLTVTLPKIKPTFIEVKE
jgi:HSP20 family protein